MGRCCCTGIQDQLELLRAEPERWPGAIEEMLRFDSPVQMTSRTALCDTEIGGTAGRASPLNTATAPTTFEDVIESLNPLPSCTFRFDNVRCRHRAEWHVRKHPCCHVSGADLMCDTCYVRINWFFDLDVQIQCGGCGARSTISSAMYPVAVRL
jgi:hypothetical protein